jgi:hypothetical protein
LTRSQVSVIGTEHVGGRGRQCWFFSFLVLIFAFLFRRSSGGQPDAEESRAHRTQQPLPLSCKSNYLCFSQCCGSMTFCGTDADPLIRASD